MAKIGIIYGSSTGNTEDAAEKIKTALGAEEAISVDAGALAKTAEWDVVILGASTWGFGDLQDDWEGLEGNLKALDLKGKKVGFFGLGDQDGYADTFVDAIGLLHESLIDTGAEFIGSWPTEGYEFSESKAVKDGAFLGLVLDEDCQADQSADRIARWTERVKAQI